jgi:hypothetical protein
VSRQMSSLQPAAWLHVGQPRVDHLMRGQVNRFSAAAFCLSLATIILSTAVSSGAQQSPVDASPQTSPIVIPPATTGLFAGPEELQRALDESTLPQTVPELLAELAKRANDIQLLIASGSFGQVWVPAMGTKTVALALESHVGTLSEPQRAAATMAIKRIVTSAWELDASGDLGNKPKLDAANQHLTTAISDLKAAYEPR